MYIQRPKYNIFDNVVYALRSKYEVHEKAIYRLKANVFRCCIKVFYHKIFTVTFSYVT